MIAPNQQTVCFHICQKEKNYLQKMMH